ncbi:unnamed protein product [Discosporangium mesarthrocarpum]
MPGGLGGAAGGAGGSVSGMAPGAAASKGLSGLSPAGASQGGANPNPKGVQRTNGKGAGRGQERRDQGEGGQQGDGASSVSRSSPAKHGATGGNLHPNMRAKQGAAKKAESQALYMAKRSPAAGGGGQRNISRTSSSG